MISLVLLICVIRRCDRIPAASTLTDDVALLYNDLAPKYGVAKRTTGALKEKWKDTRKLRSPNSGGVWKEEGQTCRAVCDLLDKLSGSGSMSAMGDDYNSNNSQYFVGTPLDGTDWTDEQIEDWILSLVDENLAFDMNSRVQVKRLTAVSLAAQTTADEVIQDVADQQTEVDQSIDLRAVLMSGDVSEASDADAASLMAINGQSKKSKLVSQQQDRASSKDDDAKDKSKDKGNDTPTVKRRKVAKVKAEKEDAALVDAIKAITDQSKQAIADESKARKEQANINTLLLEAIKSQGEAIKSIVEKLK